MYKVIILPEAKNDIVNAAEWYDEKSDGLGYKFTLATVLQIEKIKEDIVEHNIVYKNLSRVFVKRFPYIIYFKKDKSKQEIVVYALLHNKQDRSILSKRI